MLGRVVLLATLFLLAFTGTVMSAEAKVEQPTFDEADREQVALCVYGDAYNTGGRPCQGAVCIGYTMGHWVDCYPRFPPCWACPPPPALTKLT